VGQRLYGEQPDLLGGNATAPAIAALVTPLWCIAFSGNQDRT